MLKKVVEVIALILPVTRVDISQRRTRRRTSPAGPRPTAARTRRTAVSRRATASSLARKMTFDEMAEETLKSKYH
ncbi:MAG: hypothetical protein JRG67_12810 [Deltaproteobacteria bacterium]|nr:hypothetical protein [Deltaproteobacteria bacterium]MBW2551043.1 hypothetical protein [Deltaproteobacteria bacterium]MBW2629940.1 hypothetical protein [Deltaproteobacteria bacterium]